MQLNIGIQSLSFETPMGNTLGALWDYYQKGVPAFTFDEKLDVLVSRFIKDNSSILEELDSNLGALSFADRSTLLALLAAKDLKQELSQNDRSTMISIGSSRGASALMEESFDYLRQHGKVQAYSSPMTTLGNIASFVAQSLEIEGITIEHSMTCSTALQAILNGAAWINSGMTERVIAGAVETPLTPHNIAQMKALKIYSSARENINFPVRALDLQKESGGLVLGEAAIIAVLEKFNSNSILKINSIGFATEAQRHPVSVDDDGTGLQRSMRMALASAGLNHVDAIICHATGTIGGDKAESRAIDLVFPNRPLVTSTKWMTGHTFGAAGMHGILLAALMLEKQYFITAPYLSDKFIFPAEINTVMINTLGFGGQAISVVVERS